VTIDARADHFAARGGLALLRRSWIPERPTRLLAVVHGLAEHSARYDDVARWFAARGFAVTAYDQRGHGESEGPRTHAASFDLLLDDLERFLVAARDEAPGLPLVLLGHSMGGLLVASLLAERRPRVAAAVLSGPALAIADSLSPWRAWMARSLSRLAPRLPIPRPVNADDLSRDPAVVAAYLSDPLVPRRISARLAASLLEAAAGVVERAVAVDVPVLLVHGEDDRLCPIGGSVAFRARLRPPGCELLRYPGLRHEVLNEPERERVMGDALAWIEKQVPPAGPR
jgi:alpha-beta hydrolase superfamily lysophospholipase